MSGLVFLFKKAIPEIMKQTPPTKQNYVCLGVIVTAHGLRGEVRVKSFTEPEENIAVYGPVTLLNGRTMNIKSTRYGPKGLLVTFEQVNDRTTAESLRNQYIYVPQETLPPPEEGNAYLEELADMQVVTQTGEELGVVDHAFTTSANAVIVMRHNSGKEVMLPWIDDVIAAVDSKQRIITVTPMAQQFVDL